MDTLGHLTSIGAALVAILAACTGAWLKWGRQRWAGVRRFFRRLDEVLNGRAADSDSYGRERSPAILPLVEQQAAVQTQIADLTAVVRELVSHREEIETVKADHAALRVRVSDLEAASVERIAGHIDSAAAWSAVEAVAKNDEESK